jgi:hypothetical protein
MMLKLLVIKTLDRVRIVLQEAIKFDIREQCCARGILIFWFDIEISIWPSEIDDLERFGF